MKLSLFHTREEKKGSSGNRRIMFVLYTCGQSLWGVSWVCDCVLCLSLYLFCASVTGRQPLARLWNSFLRGHWLVNTGLIQSSQFKKCLVCYLARGHLDLEDVSQKTLLIFILKLTASPLQTEPLMRRPCSWGPEEWLSELSTATSLRERDDGDRFSSGSYSSRVRRWTEPCVSEMEANSSGGWHWGHISIFCQTSYHAVLIRP